jgi:hypothetical protein
METDMNYVLFLYATIGIAKYSSSEAIAQEWKPIAVFAGTMDNKGMCESAARQLNIVNRARCVPVGMGGMS